MPKREDKHNMAEDYLAHLDWHTRFRAGRPSWTRSEPNWRYKIVYERRPPMAPIERTLITILLMILGGVGLYIAFKFDVGLAIYLSIVFLGIATILFFAIRDASGPAKD